MRCVSLGLFEGKALFLLCLFFVSVSVLADGISVDRTRVVYPADAAQVTFSITNKSQSSTYLIQSWIEDGDEKKTTDFFVTPPLYASAPNSENMLRIISAGVSHAQNQETLYYLNIKAIPSVSKKDAENSSASLVLATALQMKVFVRPPGLTPARDKAADELRFIRKGDKLVINNPTPYYLTLNGMKAGTQELTDVMVSPRGSEIISLPSGAGSTVTWRSINDYGGLDKGQGSISD